MPTHRFLFVVVPEKGHLSTPIAVAQRLERLGHEVRIASHRDVSGRLRRANLRAEARVLLPEEPTSASRSSVIRADNVKWLAQLAKLGTRVVLGPEILAATEAEVDAFRPDVLCVDPLAYHAISIAERRGLPWAGISSTLLAVAPEGWSSAMAESHALIESWRDPLFRQHGITHPVSVNEVRSPWLNLLFATEAFLPVTPRDAWAIRVGPVRHLQARGDEQPFPWERLREDVPLVYAAFGGGDALVFPEQALKDVLSSLDASEAQIVSPLLDRFDLPFATEIPAHVVTVRYAPQVALLSRASVAAVHGGANSVMECLAAGVPMLVIPIGHEQPLQAELVERAGVGFHLPLKGLTGRACGERLRALMDPAAPQRARAKEIAASYAAHDGAERAAELVVQLAETRAAIPTS